MIKDSPHNLTVEDTQWLVDLLLDCDSTKAFWDNVIPDLSKEISVGFGEDPSLRNRVYNLVTKSLKFSGEIEILLSRVRYRTDRNTAWPELARVAFRLLSGLPQEFESLTNRLVDMVEEVNPGRTVIQRICGERFLDQPRGRAFTNAYDVILLLFQRPERSQAIDFIRAIARPEISRDRSGDLQIWLEEASKCFDVQPAQPQPVSATADNYLMIQIQPVASDRFKLYRWTHIGGETRLTPHDTDQTYVLDQLASEIEETASWMLNRFATNFVVELFVKRGVFCHDITKWEVKVGGNSSKLVCEAPIVFRCLERLEARRTEIKEETQGLSTTQAVWEAWKQSLSQQKEGGPPKEFVNVAAWREKSASLPSNHEKEVVALMQHIADANGDFNKKRDALAKAICVGLGFVPAPTEDGKDAPSMAINRGAPVVIWFRDLPSGAAVDKKAFAKLLCQQKAKVKLCELRGHLWTLRKNAVNAEAANNHHHHVTLLYDDYNRVPPQPASQPPDIQ